MIGTTEILIIAGVLVLLFGATAIPKLARSIGKARAEFEKGVKEGKESKEGEESKEGQEAGPEGPGAEKEENTGK